MNKHLLIISLCICTLTSTGLQADQASERLLWPDGAPGAKGDQEGDKPSLTIYLPPEEKAAGTAVVICPGGGYGGLAMGHEGHQIAQWLNSFGVSGFILKYRHRNSGAGYGHPAPIQDAQRAIRTVRGGAGHWGVDPNRIGILGFSAGGHLASSVGTHFNRSYYANVDDLDQLSCRPDFLILGYPVISFTEWYRHTGSMRNLLGEDPDQAMQELFSNEKQVSAETPPSFLIHTYEDKAVPPENSIYFYLALRQAKVPAEMHIYLKGRHGVGLGTGAGRYQAGPNAASAGCGPRDS